MSFSVWKGRCRDALLGAPMFVKIMGLAVGMELLVSATLLWQIHHTYSQLEVHEVEGYALFTANLIAAGAAPLIRAGNVAELQPLVDEVATPSSGIHAPHSSRTIHAVAIHDGQGHRLAGLDPVDPQAQVHEATVPLPGNIGGRVTVALNHEHVDYELAWHQRSIVTTTVLLALVGMGLAWWLARLFTRPIRELVDSVRSIQAGHGPRRARIGAPDEIGKLAVAFNEMTAALEQKEAVNRHLLRKLIATAEEERKHLARELHDQTGQALTSLIAGLAALESSQGNGSLAHLRSLATQTLGEVHTLSLALRPSALDDLGLTAALRKCCQQFAARHGVQVDCETIGLDDTTRLPGELEVTLYRIVQEALTNAVRHGQARSIQVMLHRKAVSVLAVIEDDGHGFAADDWRTRCLHDDRLGLLGIEERAILLGGSLRVESQPHAGTQLFVDIPLEKQQHAPGSRLDR